ncbi:MAG: cytochrome c3 family protein [Candidatus Kapaibacterium sp.]|jgi:hypothetical protein
MFTRSTDIAIKKGIIGGGMALFVLVTIGFFGMQNRVTDRGYRPQQPVPFSHKLHVDTLSMQCQYCHAGVEKSAHSPIPSTSTCMGCHQVVKGESPKLKLVRDSWETGKPVEWVRVHKIPDYAHFNHSRHIRAQVDCQSCHEKIEEQGVVSQNKPLSMGWCLDCHRNPEKYVVPARMISGIFTGKRVNFTTKENLYTSIDPDLVKGVADRSRPITSPQFGQFETDIPKQPVKGIVHPKVPGYGPENCSACHY